MGYADVLVLARQMRKSPTEAEAYFWEKVRNYRFMRLKFYRQYIYQYDFFANEKRFFIFDFYSFKHKVCIELDGPIHDYQMEHDHIRQEIIERQKIKVVRFTNDEVLRNWPLVEAQLRRYFE